MGIFASDKYLSWKGPNMSLFAKWAVLNEPILPILFYIVFRVSFFFVESNHVMNIFLNKVIKKLIFPAPCTVQIQPSQSDGVYFLCFI
jgi:hypothetical protein